MKEAYLPARIFIITLHFKWRGGWISQKKSQIRKKKFIVFSLHLIFIMLLLLHRPQQAVGTFSASSWYEQFCYFCYYTIWYTHICAKSLLNFHFWFCWSRHFLAINKNYVFFLVLILCRKQNKTHLHISMCSFDIKLLGSFFCFRFIDSLICLKRFSF